MTKTAVRETNRVNGTDCTYTQMTDAAKNVAAASSYIQIMIDRKGRVEKGLNAFGTGPGYSNNIISAARALDANPNNPNATLRQYIGK